MGAGKLYDDGLTTPRLPGREKAAAGGEPAPTPLPPAAAPPEAAVVTEARGRRLADLRARYPRWAIWADCLGWHARRKGSFHQQHEPDSPSYSVHEADSHMLAIRLRDEDAADVPAGDWSP